MKVKKTSLEDFAIIYNHPSAILFRAIELKTIYEKCKDLRFNHPSLDLGCGDGKIADLLFDEHFTYGVDNGEAKDVDQAIKNKIYQKVFLESAEKMSLPDNSVGFVFSNCVIEHIPDNEAVLSEVGRILKPEGKFVFTVPSHNYPDYLYLTNKFTSWGLGFLSKSYKYRRNKMLNQFHCYSVSDWQKKLEKHNLEIEKHKYYVSKGALMLWDKMALEIFFKRIVWPNFEKKAFDKYKSLIKEVYEKDDVKDNQGAGLFIQCVKK
jgi:SAM-dependent methyltransferase